MRRVAFGAACTAAAAGTVLGVAAWVGHAVTTAVGRAWKPEMPDWDIDPLSSWCEPGPAPQDWWP